MFRIQLNSSYYKLRTSHSKNQGNQSLIENKSTEYNTEMTQMWGELYDKNFKAVIIEMFQQAITNTVETDEN